MDTNNTPYFLLREEAEFTHGSSHFAWHANRGALTLAQAQELRLASSEPVVALSQWQASNPLVLDLFGQIGRLDPTAQFIEYNAGRGFLKLQDGELHDVQAPLGEFVDLAIGGDGRLVAPYSNTTTSHGLLVFHLARRWQTHVAMPDIPLRAVVDIDNRIWCVTASQIYLFEGEPLPLPYQPQSDQFEPLELNPHPLSLLWQQDLPSGLSPLALCVDQEHVYILTHDETMQQQILVRSRSVEAQRFYRVYLLDEDIPFVIDLAIAAAGRLALMIPREAVDTDFLRRDVAVIHLVWDEETETGVARLIYERYPMLSQLEPRFTSCLDGQLRYQADADPNFPDFTPRPRELHPLLQPRYPKAAQVTLLRSHDSGRPDTVWHRLYIEGCIPPGTRIEVYARAYNDPDNSAAVPFILQPQPLWNPLGSELPYQQGLVESKVNESGLYEILLQRSDGNVRRLTGRYLQLRLGMEGDGRRTPAVHAIRIYYSRFSFQESYLPEHFRQEEIYIPATGDAPPTPANGADIRERFFAAFEGVLTPIEGRVAAAEVLVHPDATFSEHLPWLGELVGTKVPEFWPTQRSRRLVKNTGALQRTRGTYPGVRLALDIVTDGKVARGEVVLVENFRLRRTMATILGIDMDDRDHPLTLGTGMSGNSIVGDSLILSEEDARTFLSLFAPELATEDEKTMIKDFFDRYSHQVSVLLHGRARQDRGLIDDLLMEQMPAHVQWRIIETDHPFVLGLAPLLEVDTYLETTPPPRRVTLDDTWLGKEGVLLNPLALSPRDVNARPPVN